MVALSFTNPNNYNTTIARHLNQYNTSGRVEQVLSTCNERDEREYPQFENQVNVIHKTKHYQKRLTNSEIQQMIVEYQNGATVYELAKMFKCNRNTISNNLKCNGIQPTARKINTVENITETISLYKGGLNLEEIAEKLGVGASTVRRCLVKNDVKMRTRWEY